MTTAPVLPGPPAGFTSKGAAVAASVNPSTPVKIELPDGGSVAGPAGSINGTGRLIVTPVTAITAPTKVGELSVIGTGPAVDVTTVDGATVAEPLTVALPAPPTREGEFALAAHVGADGSWEIIPSTQDGNTITVTTRSFSVVGIVISDGLRAVGDFLAAAFAGRTEPPTCDAPPAWASVSPVSTGAVHVCARTNPDANLRAEIEVKSNRGTFQWVEIPQVPAPAFVWVEDQSDWLRATVGRIFGRNPASAVLLAPGKRLTIGYTQPIADASIAVRAYPELDTYTLSTAWQIAQYFGADSTALNLVLGLYCFGVLDLDPNVTGSTVHVPKLTPKTASCLVDTIADLGKDEATAKKTAEKVLGPGASADELSKVASKVKAVGQAAVILKLGSFIAVKLTEVADARVAAFTPEANSEAVITLKGQPPAAPKTAKCEDVGGEAASDDVATNIVATGLPCTEARTLVTKATAEHNFYSGPRTFKMNGFDCSVVTSEEGMTSGKYTCVSGGKRVTWTKF